MKTFHSQTTKKPLITLSSNFLIQGRTALVPRDGGAYHGGVGLSGRSRKMAR
jgi:hypothetical protein